MAAQRSVDDATRYSGGDLGYSTLDVLPDAYAAAVRGQAPGVVVGPVQGQGGWAVLRIEDRRLEAPPTLDQARPLIVRYLTYEGVRQLLEQLRGKAAVEVFINPVRKPAQNSAKPPVAKPQAAAAPVTPAGTVAS